ncbi:hypothetical protein B0H34DRAFT_801437 [Crassisporium funariophilum]|nr:hypothetical protein B0H34DRAFT_801437 [Crassisporium funariophilum]
MSTTMDELQARFSSLLTPEIVAGAESAYRRDMSTQSTSIGVIPPDPRNDLEKMRPSGEDDDSLGDAFMKYVKENSRPKYPPLEMLPCANVEVEKYRACPKNGKLACGACKLVSYCSQECQKVHWRVHKRDCKNPMRSQDWKPTWTRPGSLVTSETTQEGLDRKKMDQFSTGLSFWGNTPAMDMINLAMNEKDSTKDFSLAFIASGDLRHVIRTINALPSDYSGSMTVLINDGALPVVCRNIVLLLILGTISDEVLAVDIALHFWYSIFMPVEYRIQIGSMLASILQQAVMKKDVAVVPLGNCSTLSFLLDKEATMHFLHYQSPSVSLEDAQNEYDRVRTAPSRHDFRQRMYAQLRPSHRVAFQEFRRFGILLPFGAMNSHFNVPNNSLFSPKVKWLQKDFADPLQSWDLVTVMNAGKRHGALPEDIYGCLYFYITEQLREFSKRLRQFKISFTVFPLDARDLSRAIREDAFSQYGIPASIRFDRIEVSNILDANYVGISDVLTQWGPFLAGNSSAAIVGYFMNWVGLQADGLASGSDSTHTEKIISRVVAENKDRILNSITSPGDVETMLYLVAGDIEVLYDNSGPFATFLRKQGLDDILRKTKLKLRKTHSIVPHRIMAPLQGQSSALPVFPDDETKYYYTQLSTISWSERFVEFARG